MGQTVEKLKVTAETTVIRGRGWLRLGVQLLGIALIALAGWNMLLARAMDVSLMFTEYRTMMPTAPFFADVALIAIGAAIAKIA